MDRCVAHGAVGCEGEEGRAGSGKRDRLGECIQGEKIFRAWEKDANGYVRVVIGAYVRFVAPNDPNSCLFYFIYLFLVFWFYFGFGFTTLADSWWMRCCSSWV